MTNEGGAAVVQTDFRSLAEALLDAAGEKGSLLAVGYRAVLPDLREALARRKARKADPVRTLPDGMPPCRAPGWAAGMALAGREPVWCLLAMDAALSGPALEAALFAARRGLSRLTLAVWGGRPAGCDPAAVYAALGWKALEVSAANERGLRETLAARGEPLRPRAVFLAPPRSIAGKEAEP